MSKTAEDKLAVSTAQHNRQTHILKKSNRKKTRRQQNEQQDIRSSEIRQRETSEFVI